MNDTRVARNHRPSRSTLAELPARVLTFLNAIALRDPIWISMHAGGFRQRDHLEGWRLLTQACRCRKQAQSGQAQCKAQQAIAELHQWTTTHFGRFRAAVERLHPEATELFPELDSRYPTQSLLAMSKLIERLRGEGSLADAPAIDSLRTGGNSEPTVFATLSQRGLDDRELRRLAQLVADAQSIEAVSSESAELDTREADLLALYSWYRDWAETAKGLIGRKDLRAALGLTRRQASTVDTGRDGIEVDD